MTNSPGSSAPRRQPPVARYAFIVGLLILASIIGVVYGARHQNPKPNPVSSGAPDTNAGSSAR